MKIKGDKMINIKDYPNLYRMYSKCINKFRLPFFVCLALFILAFATFLIDGFPFTLTLIMMGMVFPAILYGILWPFFAVRAKKFIKAFYPQQLSAIDAEIPSAVVCESLLVTSQAVICKKMGLTLIPMANVLWVYPEITVVKLNGVIPIRKYTMLHFAGRDKKRYAFNIKNNQQAYIFMQSELLRYRKDIVFGTEYGMDEIYKNDINRMIAFSLECAAKRQ